MVHFLYPACIMVAFGPSLLLIYRHVLGNPILVMSAMTQFFFVPIAYVFAAFVSAFWGLILPESIYLFFAWGTYVIIVNLFLSGNTHRTLAYMRKILPFQANSVLYRHPTKQNALATGLGSGLAESMTLFLYHLVAGGIYIRDSAVIFPQGQCGNHALSSHVFPTVMPVSLFALCISINHVCFAIQYYCSFRFSSGLVWKPYLAVLFQHWLSFIVPAAIGQSSLFNRLCFTPFIAPLVCTGLICAWTIFFVIVTVPQDDPFISAAAAAAAAASTSSSHLSDDHFHNSSRTTSSLTTSSSSSNNNNSPTIGERTHLSRQNSSISSYQSTHNSHPPTSTLHSRPSRGVRFNESGDITRDITSVSFDKFENLEGDDSDSLSNISDRSSLNGSLSSSQ